MGWIYLVLAGTAEIFYAAAMPKTDGFTRLGPSLFCIAFIMASGIVGLKLLSAEFL